MSHNGSQKAQHKPKWLNWHPKITVRRWTVLVVTRWVGPAAGKEAYRALLAFLQQPGAEAWLHAVPSSALGLYVVTPLFRIMMRLRLRLPVSDSALACPLCHGTTDRNGDHARVCSCGGDRIKRQQTSQPSGCSRQNRGPPARHLGLSIRAAPRMVLPMLATGVLVSDGRPMSGYLPGTCTALPRLISQPPLQKLAAASCGFVFSQWRSGQRGTAADVPTLLHRAAAWKCLGSLSSHWVADCFGFRAAVRPWSFCKGDPSRLPCANWLKLLEHISQHVGASRNWCKPFVRKAALTWAEWHLPSVSMAKCSWTTRDRFCFGCLFRTVSRWLCVVRLNYLNYTIILGKKCVFFFPPPSLIYRNIFALNLQVPSDTARHLLPNAVAPREGKTNGAQNQWCSNTIFFKKMLEPSTADGWCFIIEPERVASMMLRNSERKVERVATRMVKCLKSIDKT